MSSPISPEPSYPSHVTPLAVPNPSFWAPPDVSRAAFIAANAVVIGNVDIGEGVSVWYGATVRADVEDVRIGCCTNVQDGAVLHCDPGLPTVLADHVTIGHRAVIHSATIGSGSLIGIGAIILNGVTVGAGCIIGAGSVVTKDVPPHSLVMGVPGKVVRPLKDEQVQELIAHAQHYEQLALVHANRGTNLGFTH
ncbi:MAG: gamma carbonic anhydrase family protein [Cyanobacteria bacterium P01_F01_bin.150]